MKKLLVFCCVSLFWGGEIPEWFLNPPLSSTKVIGLGQGSDISSAKKKAIDDLANSLQVNVKSKFNQTESRENDSFSSTSSQTINLQSQVDDLMNIEPTKAQCIEKNQCYVLVEITKTNLANQLKRKIMQQTKEAMTSSSPFEYPYKKDLISKIQKNYSLYLSLGGSEMQIPTLGDKPTFDLIFEYSGDFPKSSKSILEKTIQDYLTKIGKLSLDSEWKVVVNVLTEGKNVTLEVSVQHKGEVIHNTSVYDTQKPNISNSFFAKRLGVQVNKKMQKWGKNN